MSQHSALVAGNAALILVFAWALVWAFGRLAGIRHEVPTAVWHQHRAEVCRAITEAAELESMRSQLRALHAAQTQVVVEVRALRGRITALESRPA